MTVHLAERLSPYLDGELSPAETASVAAHLRECPACSERLAELAAVDELAQGLTVAAPPGYFEAFPARVREKLPPGARPARRLPLWALAAAAVLLIAVITPLSLRERSFGPSVAEPARSLGAPPASAGGPPAKPGALDDLGYQEARREADLGLERKDTAAPSGSRLAAEGERAVAKQALPPPAAPPPTMPEVASGDARQGSVGGVADQTRPAAAKARGPWYQGQVQSPSALATLPPDQIGGAENQGVAQGKAVAEQRPRPEREPAADARIEPEPAAASARSEKTTAPLPDKDERTGLEALAARQPRNATEARAVREAARLFAAENPSDAQADRARVLVVESGALAFRFSHDPADRERVEVDAKAYLARADAQQAARVRALLAAVSR